VVHILADSIVVFDKSNNKEIGFDFGSVNEVNDYIRLSTEAKIDFFRYFCSFLPTEISEDVKHLPVFS
jgi:hypothetical protein